MFPLPVMLRAVPLLESICKSPPLMFSLPLPLMPTAGEALGCSTIMPSLPPPPLPTTATADRSVLTDCTPKIGPNTRFSTPLSDEFARRAVTITAFGALSVGVNCWVCVLKVPRTMSPPELLEALRSSCTGAPPALLSRPMAAASLCAWVWSSLHIDGPGQGGGVGGVLGLHVGVDDVGGIAGQAQHADQGQAHQGHPHTHDAPSVGQTAMHGGLLAVTL